MLVTVTMELTGHELLIVLGTLPQLDLRLRLASMRRENLAG